MSNDASGVSAPNDGLGVDTRPLRIVEHSLMADAIYAAFIELGDDVGQSGSTTRWLNEFADSVERHLAAMSKEHCVCASPAWDETPNPK